MCIKSHYVLIRITMSFKIKPITVSIDLKISKTYNMYQYMQTDNIDFKTSKVQYILVRKQSVNC